MKKYIFFIVLTFTISCIEKGDTEYITVHPAQEYMPYSSFEPVKLEARYGGDFLHLLPKNVQILYNILNNESGNLKPEELQILTTNDIDVKSINKSDLLILEKDNARLIQYSLIDNEYDIIADKGRGPGDLFFPKELTVYKEKAFVGMQAFQISFFLCDGVFCEYENTLNTKFNNYSIAPVDDFIKFLGIKPFGREQHPDPSNTDQNLIHKIDYNGEIYQSYFPVYDYRSSLVRQTMNSGGQIRSFPELETIVITFDFFPYVYVFNDSGELNAKYEFPEYIQAYYESEENRAGGFTGRYIFDSSVTSIRFTSKIDEKWMLVGIRDRREVEFISMEEGFDGYEWFSYYAFDVEEKKIYKIGDDTEKPYGESRILHVVDNGVVINEAGTLFFISDS